MTLAELGLVAVQPASSFQHMHQVKTWHSLTRLSHSADLECRQLLATDDLRRHQLLLWRQLRQRHLLHMALLRPVALPSPSSGKGVALQQPHCAGSAWGQPQREALGGRQVQHTRE